MTTKDLKMAEINKLLFEKKNDETRKKIVESIKTGDDLKKIVGDMKSEIERSIMRDFKKAIESMEPPQQTILTWVYQSIEKLRKSTDDTGRVTINLSKRLNWLTWVLIVIGVAGIVLMIINLCRR